MGETYKSRVYTDRPAYADFNAPAKFQAIQSIIAKRLKQHPNAICSYSGGADSDILLDLIERTRDIFYMSRIEGMTHSEIAEILGISTRAVEKHLQNSVQEYRRHFGISDSHHTPS